MRIEIPAVFPGKDVPVIELDRVSRFHPPATHALRQVSLSVFSGESVAIVGPSGSGKSTLLGILGLLDRPTSGQVWLEGAEARPENDSWATRARARSIAFVFQSFQLIGHLTALENVELGLLIQGRTFAESRDLANGALEQVGLSHRADFRSVSLSGGEQQRVAIARAIVRSPQILLCDEPTGNLDSANAEAVLAVLLELANRGTAVVVVTHDMDIAARCNRQVVLRDGELVN